MRNLFFLVLVLIGAFMAGWFTIDREGDRTLIEINRSEIRNDARQVIDRGRELLDRAEQLPESEGERFYDQQVYQPQADQTWGEYQAPTFRYQEQVARQPEWQQPLAPQPYNQ